MSVVKAVLLLSVAKLVLLGQHLRQFVSALCSCLLYEAPRWPPYFHYRRHGTMASKRVTAATPTWRLYTSCCRSLESLSRGCGAEYNAQNKLQTPRGCYQCICVLVYWCRDPLRDISSCGLLTILCTLQAMHAVSVS